MNLRRATVVFLERACAVKDRLPGPFAGIGGCGLANLSSRLDERWGTKAWTAPDPLRVHAEAMADALEDLITCEHSDDMWDRAREAWQAYVDWADRPPRAG